MSYKQEICDECRCKRYAMRLVPALPGFELHVKHAAKGGAQ